MEWLLSAALLGPALLWSFAFVSLLRAVRAVAVLAELPADREEWPRLSVVSPACNEEEGIAAALASLAAQDYPGLEVIAVNDRSTDRTGALIDVAARANPRIAPVHLSHLPDGWLGKLNAMNEGIRRSSADWFLLADADVRFGPLALKKAIAYAESRQLDFLTALPQIDPAGFLADTVFSVSGVALGLQFPPWKLRDPNRPEFFGIGAFMLVRRAAYDRSPGLEWLKLEVADDLGMALLLKKHGGKCDVVNGRGLLLLHWYSSFNDMKEKMQKNFFAVIGRFSLARSLAMAATVTYLALGPMLALRPATPLPFRVIGLVGQLCFMGCAATYAGWTGRKLFAGFFPNAAMLLIAFMCVRAAILGRRMGGIRWRGHLYETKLLASAQRVRM